MNAIAYAQTLELREEHELKQKGWISSLIVHALLIMLLLMAPKIAPPPAALTEFTWLEDSGTTKNPVEVAAPPVQAATEKPKLKEKPSPQPTTQARFERVENEKAEVEPKPQSLTARDDRLSERLAALRDSKPTLAVETPHSSALLKAPATELAKTGAVDEKKLIRESGVPTAAPSELRRERTLSRTPSLANVKPTEVATAPSAIIPKNADLTVRRTLSGASLAGPAADRPIRKYIMPAYPEWAKKEGVEGTVMLSFVVLPDGSVKKNVMVHRTSGYQDFDLRAQQALRLWRFEALPAGSNQEQWGSITIHFRLTS